MGKTRPTWRPNEPAPAWKLSDHVLVAKERRRALIKKRQEKHGEFYDNTRGRYDYTPVHWGPCVPRRLLVERGSIIGRVLGTDRGFFREIAGRGHRLRSYDARGNEVHPSSPSVRRKVCEICGRTWKRVQA